MRSWPAAVVVLFFAMQSPELVDRWLWLPFMLALCFRGRPKTSEGPMAATAAVVEPLVETQHGELTEQSAP